jgi:hypothetical protein
MTNAQGMTLPNFNKPLISTGIFKSFCLKTAVDNRLLIIN